MLPSQVIERWIATLVVLLAVTSTACSGGSGERTVGVSKAGLGANLISDSFHTGSLDPALWQVVDPQGNGTVTLVGAGTQNAQLRLSVPAGTVHDAWSPNTALRAMQAATNEDFEVEVKFESQPLERFQGQGILVEQNGDSFLRFDVYSDGSSLHVFSATFSNGAPTIRVNTSIAGGALIYLRLSRSGNQWTGRYSYDGANWTTAGSFSHTMTVTSVGVFAGNFNPNPAYTAIVDYFFETNSPIQDDPPLCDPTAQYQLTTQATGGSIGRSPSQSSYGCGEVVTLTAQPDPGSTFLGWGGDLSGTANPTDLLVTGDMMVSATFEADTAPPQISNVNVSVGATSAVVSWQTSEPSTGSVQYGPTTAYELGSVASATLATIHSVNLPGLTEGALYHYRISAADALGNNTSGSDATFMTRPPGTGGAGIVSDDFHTGMLNGSVWEVVDPNGDGTVEVVGGGTSDAQLRLSVPSGTAHDAWSSNTALRAMQPASDQDFELQVKFDSQPTQQYQGQGLLVEQDATNYLRFDVYHDGSSLKVFSSTFTNGAPNVRANTSIPSGATIYLRLTRSGNQWTGRYSYDGVAWSTAATFSHSLAVSSVGVFAGNFTPNPAYTAVVDYFFETSAPIEPEDAPPCDPLAQYTLTTQATGGTIERSPNQATYGCNSVVTLTAQPDPGATFLGWGGELSGTTNPAEIVINANTSVTASFGVDTAPPQVSNVNVTPSTTSALVAWQTDESSSGTVEYGLTASYELGAVPSSSQATMHSVNLTGLMEGALYHFRITVEDGLGNSTSTSDSTFVTGASGAIVSDDFHTGTLDSSLWQVVDPQGDGSVTLVGAGTADAHLLLAVPAGTSHDAWTTNTALRVMQPAADEDLEIEVKFESQPTQQYQSQGLIVEQDPSNYVRFDVYSDGAALHAFSATFSNGSSSVRGSSIITSGAPIYMRLARSGNQWTARYSHDGSSWTTQSTFSHTMTVWSVGVFAGNFSPNPAHTAIVDYFFDTSSPIAQEDALPCNAGEQFTLTAAASGPGSVTRNPNKASYGCGEAVTLTAQPDAGAAFVSWSGALSGSTNPTNLVVSGNTSVTATFQLDSQPPAISNVSVTPSGSSATVHWQTDEPSVGSVAYGPTPAYGLGSIASNTPATSHTVILPSLADGQTYHYRITAVDSFGNSANTNDATFVNAVEGPVINVWYGDSQSFGALGNPQQWVNVLGNVSDPNGVASLTYSLNGGAPQNMGIGPYKRLAEPGDFNVELDYQTLLPGNNTIELRAVDGSGFETVRIVNVDYSAGNNWALPTVVNWSSATEVNDVAQIVDGPWSIVDDKLRDDTYGYDRIVALGDIAWTNYEVTVPVTIHSTSAQGFVGENVAPGVGLFLRWVGHFDWNGEQPRWGYYPIGGGAWVSLEFADGSGKLLLKDFTPGGINVLHPSAVIQLGPTYMWKVRVQTQQDGTSLYQLKTWLASDPEPGPWQLSAVDSSDLPAGGVALVAHFADVSFGNVVINPL